MALATYTGLIGAVARGLNDQSQTSNIPDFITLAESSIATDVRLRDQVARDSLTTVVDQGYVSIPADWLEFIEVKYNGKPLDYVTPSQFTDKAKESGTITCFTIEGDRLLLAPTPTEAVPIDVTYYAKIDALETTATNFLLTKYPQIYLAKSLAWAFKFQMADAKAATWESVYKQAISEATSADKSASISGAPLRIRTR